MQLMLLALIGSAQTSPCLFRRPRSTCGCREQFERNLQHIVSALSRDYQAMLLNLLVVYRDEVGI